MSQQQSHHPLAREASARACHDGAASPADTYAPGPTAADRVGQAVLFPVAVAQRVLPERDLPVYLGAGALAVAGLIDWPVAVAAGLGYAALKRWRRPPATSD